MGNYESFGDFEYETSQSDMDPILRSKITTFAEDGHDLAALEEVFGVENVKQAAINNPTLQELIDPSNGEGYAA